MQKLGLKRSNMDKHGSSRAIRNDVFTLTHICVDEKKIDIDKIDIEPSICFSPRLSMSYSEAPGFLQPKKYMSPVITVNCCERGTINCTQCEMHTSATHDPIIVCP